MLHNICFEGLSEFESILLFLEGLQTLPYFLPHFSNLTVFHQNPIQKMIIYSDSLCIKTYNDISIVRVGYLLTEWYTLRNLLYSRGPMEPGAWGTLRKCSCLAPSISVIYVPVNQKKHFGQSLTVNWITTRFYSLHPCPPFIFPFLYFFSRPSFSSFLISPLFLHRILLFLLLRFSHLNLHHLPHIPEKQKTA